MDRIPQSAIHLDLQRVKLQLYSPLPGSKAENGGLCDSTIAVGLHLSFNLSWLYANIFSLDIAFMILTPSYLSIQKALVGSDGRKIVYLLLFAVEGKDVVRQI